jgi:outer membrane receptor protein involved in Fe transport
LVDFRAGVETSDDKWRLSAFINNVTNEYYWHSAVRIQDTTVRYPGMPRTYGVGLAVKF